MLARACVYAIMVDRADAADSNRVQLIFHGLRSRATRSSTRHFLEVKANMSRNPTPHLPCRQWIAVFLVVLTAVTPALPVVQEEYLSPAQAELDGVSLTGLKMAIRDLMKRFPQQYSEGPEYLQAVERFERDLPQIRKGLREHDMAAIEQVQQMVALQRTALLDNPLLDFDRLLVIGRTTKDWAGSWVCPNRVLGSSTP